MFANETNQSVLTADQRGRQPISPRMAERYVAALGVLDELTSGDGGTVSEDARSRLSELQGMANRILRRDQADWVDVRRVLGSPDRHRLSVLRDLAASTNRALKDEAPDVSRLRENLVSSGWAQALAEARETLKARLADAAESDFENTPATTAHQPEQKEAEPVTAVEEVPATQAATTKEGFLRALETSAAADRMQEARGSAPRTQVGPVVVGPAAGRLRGRRRQLRHQRGPVHLRSPGGRPLHV